MITDHEAIGAILGGAVTVLIAEAFFWLVRRRWHTVRGTVSSQQEQLLDEYSIAATTLRDLLKTLDAASYKTLVIGARGYLIRQSRSRGDNYLSIAAGAILRDADGPGVISPMERAALIAAAVELTEPWVAERNVRKRENR